MLKCKFFHAGKMTLLSIQCKIKSFPESLLSDQLKEGKKAMTGLTEREGL